MVEETKKQPEVEIDLDDVKETEIQLKDQPKDEKKEEVKLNVGEVDLGYTDHAQKKDEKSQIIIEEKETFVEPKVETKIQDEDDLSGLSEKAQKRIDKLTRKYRESERREQAALEYAKGLQKKYSDFEKKYDSGEELYLKEFEARIDSQREQVKAKLQSAHEANDSAKIVEAQDELTKLTVEKEKVRIRNAERQERQKASKEESVDNKVSQKTQSESQIPPPPSEKAKSWAQKNTWFGNDKIMTNAAFTIHEDLVGSGVAVDSEEYYNEIDKQIKENFPHKFVQEQRKPVQTVASAGRKQEGRRTVRLTKSQVAIAKKLGVPLEEYAKYVKEV